MAAPIRLAQLAEDNLVKNLLQGLVTDGLKVGPGDDCAVVDTSVGSWRLLKTDAVIEGRHFLADTDPQAVGWKAVARVISDFAAMGGQARFLLITLILPTNRQLAWVQGLYHGIRRCLDTYGATLAGGETCALAAGAPTIISVSGEGEVARERCVTRRGGAAGDILAVTGRLGGSFESGRHLSFQPRVREGMHLAAAGVTAMMDVSDGLARDLPRLANASGCSYQLDLEKLPRYAGVTLEQALGDGEDYELLFACPPSVWHELCANYPGDFAPVTAIGTLGEATAASTPLPQHGGWDHFQSMPNPSPHKF